MPTLIKLHVFLISAALPMCKFLCLNLLFCINERVYICTSTCIFTSVYVCARLCPRASFLIFSFVRCLSACVPSASVCGFRKLGWIYFIWLACTTFNINKTVHTISAVLKLQFKQKNKIIHPTEDYLFSTFSKYIFLRDTHNSLYRITRERFNFLS